MSMLCFWNSHANKAPLDLRESESARARDELKCMIRKLSLIMKPVVSVQFSGLSVKCLNYTVDWILYSTTEWLLTHYERAQNGLNAHRQVGIKYFSIMKWCSMVFSCGGGGGCCYNRTFPAETLVQLQLSFSCLTKYSAVQKTTTCLVEGPCVNI